jgi:hypothetical protein
MLLAAQATELNAMSPCSLVGIKLASGHAFIALLYAFSHSTTSLSYDDMSCVVFPVREQESWLGLSDMVDARADETVDGHTKVGGARQKIARVGNSMEMVDVELKTFGFQVNSKRDVKRLWTEYLVLIWKRGNWSEGAFPTKHLLIHIV